VRHLSKLRGRESFADRADHAGCSGRSDRGCMRHLGKNILDYSNPIRQQ
jgi:hypothetical protein